ncbi:uncharacterized protein LOC132054167 [Lycium ferocissimum]|uniref:uncharacterized protein LOC132054167 n=1 Tax=Lycium ferocissimum TaxID=112874 RepID=UPI002814AE60|nr:uncharacterized protein LOC132054167 [Lycium ferocissimum]
MAINDVTNVTNGVTHTDHGNNNQRSMRSVLLGRNKLGIVDGTDSKDKFPGLENQWERVNVIVLSWVMNFVSKELLGGIMYASSAQLVWEDLIERFHKIDGSRTFTIHKEIATLTQGTNFVSKNEVFPILMGLNDTYKAARSQILLMNPMPSVNQAYSMIMSDEGQNLYPKDFQFKRKNGNNSSYYENSFAHNVMSDGDGYNCGNGQTNNCLGGGKPSQVGKMQYMCAESQGHGYATGPSTSTS